MSFKTYSNYKDSGVNWIGLIPVHWNINKFSRLFKLIGSGTTPNSNNEKYFDGDIPWLLTGDLNDSYITDTSKHITEKAKKAYSTLKMYPKNSLVMAMYGATIGKLGITTFPLTTNQACCVMSDPIENVNFKYIFYWLLGNRKGIISLSYGGGQPNISQATIKSLLIPIPPLEEQNCIVNFLNEKNQQIEKIINFKQKQIETLQKYRQSFITETVTWGLNLNAKMKDSGVEWIGDIPEHWEVKKLKNIAEVQLSNVDKKSDEKDTPVFLCNYVDVYYNDEISDEIDFMKATAKKEQIKKFVLRKNDVLMTKDSETPNDIAVPSWVSMDLENVLCGYHLALIRPNKEIDGKYLFYSIKATVEQFHSKSNGVTRFGLGKDAIRNGLFPVPPLKEQIEIGNSLHKINKEILSLIEGIKNQIEILKDYQQSLIYEAVTGKIDVRNNNENELEVKL